MFDDYKSIYAKYERQQIIEKVPEEEIVKEPDKVHYLLQRSVVQRGKETMMSYSSF